MAGTDDATERSRLLNSASSRPNGDGVENGYSDHNDEQSAGDISLTKEASTRQLLAVMAATWMGVFFAALGMRYAISTKLFYSLIYCRYHNHCYTYNTNIVRVQVIKLAFLVSISILNC